MVWIYNFLLVYHATGQCCACKARWTAVWKMHLLVLFCRSAVRRIWYKIGTPNCAAYPDSMWFEESVCVNCGVYLGAMGRFENICFFVFTYPNYRCWPFKITAFLSLVSFYFQLCPMLRMPITLLRPRYCRRSWTYHVFRERMRLVMIRLLRSRSIAVPLLGRLANAGPVMRVLWMLGNFVRLSRMTSARSYYINGIHVGIQILVRAHGDRRCCVNI